MISPFDVESQRPHEEWAETRCRSASGEKSLIDPVAVHAAGSSRHGCAGNFVPVTVDCERDLREL